MSGGVCPLFGTRLSRRPTARNLIALIVLREPLPSLRDSEIARVSTCAMGDPAELLSQEFLRALKRGSLAT